MLNLFQHLTASLFLSFSADRSWNELFAFAHRKHLIFFEWGMVRMTFVYSRLIAHNSLLKTFLCLILLAGLAGFAWVKTSDAARNVPTPSPLTTLLRRICYSLFLSIRVCDPTTENMFFCSSVEKPTAHNSPLITHRWKLHLHFAKPLICCQIIKKLPYH